MLDTHELHLWRLQLDVDPEMLAAFKSTLSPQEIHQAGRFKFHTDSARYIATHGLVRKILGEYLSRPPATIEFELGRRGKPRLAMRHATKLHFNYSYSHDNLLLALSAHREVGVDIERRRDDVEIFDIAAQHFSFTERQIIRSSTTPIETFFRCWTAKEAVVKAIGHGLSQPLSSFTTLAAEGLLVNSVHMARDAGSSCDIALRIVQVMDGYCAAVALVTEESDADPIIVLK